jgi:mannose-6-phosphate isomerase-like protein (cupin superfamily)
LKAGAARFLSTTADRITDGNAVIVPAGVRHNVVNTSDAQQLKIYTIYSPPHHCDGAIRAMEKDAETDNEEFDGPATE